MGTFEPFIEYALSVFVTIYVVGILIALLSIWAIHKKNKEIGLLKCLVRYLVLPFGSWIIVFVVTFYYALTIEKWKHS
jgi:hypothetical protein